MTVPRGPHPEFEELISASLTGDLTAAERRRLDEHLDACDACRGTLASFADGRRIVAGLRHVPVPRDLHARVRAGIESGAFAAVPWWRRPAVIFAGIGGSLAAVAGAMLAVVLLNQPAGPVGDASPTPTTTVAVSVTPEASGTPAPATPVPTTHASPSAAPTETAATPEPTPVATAPEPDLYLAHTGPADNRALTVREGTSGGTVTELETPPGPPIAAELSPDGQFLAYIVEVGEKGTHEVWVARVADAGEQEGPAGPDQPPPIDSPLEIGEAVKLGESITGDPFVEPLFWSAPRGAQLAFTLTDPGSDATDVWLFTPETGEARQLTDIGTAYAASWATPDDRGPVPLWISVAGARPVSYLWGFPFDGGDGPITDPSSGAVATAEGVFQPLLSPNNRFAIYWDGAMATIDDESEAERWQFDSGAQPYLAEYVWESEVIRFDNARPVFRDLSVGRDGFIGGRITWGPDGDTYAVWDAQWTGPVQSGSNEDDYPDARRVYLTRATDARGMTRFHALDRDDLPEDAFVVDVKISPTGRHLVITARRPIGGVLEGPKADLLLVERNTGDVADAVRVIEGSDDGFWYGPAAFDDR